jgi:demethylmenaquinone methyltransferase/2-methoxy-6-polyprenyl-1,4-benzoquinol methylase
MLLDPQSANSTGSASSVRHGESSIWDDPRLADPHAQPDKAARVRAMFDGIAPTYERVNRILSLGRDRFWRRRAVALAGTNAEDRVLDLACGTGDFARAFAEANVSTVVGCDFAEQMLNIAASRGSKIAYCRGDAMTLPYANQSFTIVSCAFGVRNFQNLGHSLAEMARVLRPGGRVVILEFSTPRTPLLGSLYGFYFRRILPIAATWLSGDRTGAYRYLPRSVATFLDAAQMAEALRSAGFARVTCHRLTFGVVSVHVGWKE